MGGVKNENPKFLSQMSFTKEDKKFVVECVIEIVHESRCVVAF